MIKTLDEALKRIEELEKQIEEQNEEIERLKARGCAGRKKHDETWTKSYNDFVVKLESGMPMVEIINSSDISRRTAYRYKAYYKEINKGVKNQ